MLTTTSGNDVKHAFRRNATSTISQLNTQLPRRSSLARPLARLREHANGGAAGVKSISSRFVMRQQMKKKKFSLRCF